MIWRPQKWDAQLMRSSPCAPDSAGKSVWRLYIAWKSPTDHGSMSTNSVQHTCTTWS